MSSPYTGLSAKKFDLKLLGGDTVKVVVRRIEDHRLVEAFLQANNLQYHTFSLKRVKPLSVILRGLDAHTDPQEILLELREIGYPVQAIFRLFTNSENRVPLPLVRLHLEKGEAADKIFHLTRLFGFRVRVESSRPPGQARAVPPVPEVYVALFTLFLGTFHALSLIHI